MSLWGGRCIWMKPQVLLRAKQWSRDSNGEDDESQLECDTEGTIKEIDIRGTCSSCDHQLVSFWGKTSLITSINCDRCGRYRDNEVK
ncbi:zinc-finger protein zpr1 [Moniliophthora roreri]|nr:zinc-finger protein zpr1 [Moniliophthora roreri]